MGEHATRYLVFLFEVHPLERVLISVLVDIGRVVLSYLQSRSELHFLKATAHTLRQQRVLPHAKASDHQITHTHISPKQ